MPNAMMPLPYLLLLLAAPLVARGQECTLAQPPTLAKVQLLRLAAPLLVPAAWKLQVEEFEQGVHVVDTSSGCRLEVARLQSISVADAVVLHERLYWGGNQLSQGCRASLAMQLAPGSDAASCHVGLYEPRMYGYKHLVWIQEMPGKGARMVLLRCPRTKQSWLSWSVFVAVASSLSEK